MWLELREPGRDLQAGLGHTGPSQAGARNLDLFFFFKTFVWLHWVLLAARGVFSFGV